MLLINRLLLFPLKCFMSLPHRPWVGVWFVCLCVYLFILFLTSKSTIFSHVGRGPPGLSSTKQKIKCL